MYKAVLPLSLAVLAAASPTPGGIPASQCNTGPIQCCNNVQKASDPSAAALLGLLGVVLQDLNVLVGITCTPISVIGIGGNSCNAQPVCCTNNNFNGLITVGCTPVNLNL
ncbi:sc3 hydrophobin [Paramarasmius palmivorus]|uniref:Hydrophobin n=1 Tax=Paramarasmius palmivorus TaxID=297713 RepID=A0AAW0CD96_9AGAR